MIVTRRTAITGALMVLGLGSCFAAAPANAYQARKAPSVSCDGTAMIACLSIPGKQPSYPITRRGGDGSSDVRVKPSWPATRGHGAINTDPLWQKGLGGPF
jgi:hypothetical protein